MPQFDTTFFGSQVFWLMLCFGALWGGMHALIVPAFRKIIKQRQDRLQVLTDQTRQAQDELETVLARTEDELQQAQTAAKALVAEAIAATQAYVQHYMDEKQMYYRQETQKAQDTHAQDMEKMLVDVQQQVPAIVKTYVERYMATLDLRPCDQDGSGPSE